MNAHPPAAALPRPAAPAAAGWLPLALLPVAGLAGRNALPGWAGMWLLAGALFAGCKWLTFWTAGGGRAPRGRAVAYLLGWPGMDARAFLFGAPPARPAAADWARAAGKTLLGIALAGLGVAPALRVAPLLGGWVGMVGLILALHFGTFHLLALAWRTAGYDAKPLMDRPLLATSLADFWGRRWNTAFHELVYRYTFRPLLRAAGPAGATLAVFGLSGVIHELVITVPARGAYGRPTAYFLLHGLGVLFERSAPGRRLGLGRGWRGWLFTLLVALAPLAWLFPPEFVHRVILPFLTAIGAT